MKKFAMGIVVGAVLAFGASSYADEISQLIGKQVDNEYPVILNGKKLDNAAPSISGTSYAPVREISEKLGLNVKFENDTVILSKPQEVVKVTEQTQLPVEPVSKIDPSISTIEVNGTLFFSKNDYTAKFGNKIEGGEIFSENDGILWINKKNGQITTIKLNDTRFIQTVDGKLYIIESAYPG